MYDLYRCIAQGEPVYLPEDVAPQPAEPVDRFMLASQYLTPSGALRVSELADDLSAAQRISALYNALPDTPAESEGVDAEL